MARKCLPHFDRQAGNFVVVECLRKDQIFLTFTTLDVFLLARNIALVFGLNFHLFRDGRILNCTAKSLY